MAGEALGWEAVLCPVVVKVEEETEVASAVGWEAGERVARRWCRGQRCHLPTW